MWRSRYGQMPSVLCVAASGYHRFLGVPWPWLHHSGFSLLHIFIPIFCLSQRSFCLSLRQIVVFGKLEMTSSTSLYKSYTDLLFKQDNTSLELRRGCLFRAILIPAIRVRTTLTDLWSSGHYQIYEENWDVHNRKPENRCCLPGSITCAETPFFWHYWGYHDFYTYW